MCKVPCVKWNDIFHVFLGCAKRNQILMVLILDTVFLALGKKRVSIIYHISLTLSTAFNELFEHNSLTV